MSRQERLFNHLRPTTTPEMLDRVYAVSARVAPVLWGAGLIYAIPYYLLAKELNKVEDPDPYMLAGTLALTLFAEYAIAVAFLALFQGLIFPRRPLSPKALARTALRKLPGFFFTTLLYWLIITALGTITVAIFLSDETFGHPFFPTAAAVVFGLFGFWVSIRLCLAPIICLIEDANPFSAFVRSRHLTSKRAATSHRRADHPVFRWFSVAALPAAVMVVLAGAFAFYAFVRLGLLLPFDWASPAVSNLADALDFLVSWIAVPFYWAGLMALYVEYRMRHEAFDFYLRIRELRRKEGDGTGAFGVGD